MRQLRTVTLLSTAAVLAVLATPLGSAGAAPRPATGSVTAAPDRRCTSATSPSRRSAPCAGRAWTARTSRRGAPAGRPGRVGVEVVLDRSLAAKLVAQGVPLAEKRVDGRPVSRLLAEDAAPQGVFRSYSAPGGIRDELVEVARAHPGLVKLETIGTTVQGQRLLAVKVTKHARRVRDGSRPAVLYSAAQHAREWITPEMNRRLLHHVVDGYATDPRIRRLLDTTELWFVPVANPDGYDFTFTEGNRLWRKNLRDNDGDGRITGQDGVDPNRNFPTKWGYDNEGSSASWSSETYRGAAPASEPETRALDRLMRRIGFAFQVNYHSAAELLLYGVGWQVATPSPDDLVYEAQAGDDAHPAVPGYDPDLSAELYTTNGETTEHAQMAYGTLAYTPEMSTCQTASAIDPDDAFEPDACESVFSFPDSEPLVEGEFEKNLPFALAVAESAADPGHPVSPVGRETPDFDVDAFSVSYGDPQTVAVTARRELRHLTLRYSVDGGRTHRTGVREWRGGERYGGEDDTYYAEFRGVVRGTRPGDRVRVWFTARQRDGARTRSEPFTYRVAEDTRHRVLVVADEDYDGVNPTYDPPLAAPKYAATYAAALRRAGLRASVWDVSRQGVPHPLGVLGHFRGVLWYDGDNRLTQDPEDELTETFFAGDLPDTAVAEREQDLTIAVRDFLNEGGKLVDTGETATYYGLLAPDIGGIYYGLDGDPTADCVVTQDPFSDCLLLADDFAQYYLGRTSRTVAAEPAGFAGSGALSGTSGPFGGDAVAANPLDEPGTFAPTSAVLPPDRFPLFAGSRAGRYTGGEPGPLDPVEGSWYVGGLHVDDSYMRLARTVDLTGVDAAQAPTLAARLSFDTEPGYDSVVVEAHTVGQDDWTTLPEAGGLSTTDVPTECEVGFLLEEHPFLAHYLTLGDPCTPTGTTGAWNAMTASSDGWQDASFDLSAYAGTQVEVSISFVTDSAFGGAGAFVDDTRLLVDGATVGRAGFERGLGPWRVGTQPPGSSPSGGTFERSAGAFSPAIRTADTVLLGFGVEQLSSAADRARVLGRAFRSIGVR